MKPVSRSPELTNASRRDFLKFLPLAGGAFLLSSCTGTEESTPTAAFSPADTSNPTESSSPSPEVIPSNSPTQPPSETPTLTSQPSSEYLPVVDGSYSSFTLPSPQFPAMALSQALQERHSSRTFKQDELPVSFISAILWAGFGINRTDGKRTAPSAYNIQDIDIFLAVSKGLFRYAASDHSLVPISTADLRSLSGTQGYVSTAPMNLIYVSDHNRFSQGSAEERLQWSWAHSGCIAQNVYLACAALGMATVVRSTINRDPLAAQMGLGSNQHITLAQTIGYPG